MGYMKIKNLHSFPAFYSQYEGNAVVYMEKVHGTSAHISCDENGIKFFAGGCPQDEFEKVFVEKEALAESLQRIRQHRFSKKITVFGEAYGGKIQRMSKHYSPNIRFIAFEVLVQTESEKTWLPVREARILTNAVGLRFVPYVERLLCMESLREYSQLPSEVAEFPEKEREGTVIRGIHERMIGPDRSIAKYKNPNFRETGSPREPGAPMPTLASIRAIAEEWTTYMRLIHVLGKEDRNWSKKDLQEIVSRMVADIGEECDTNDIESFTPEEAKAFRKEVGSLTAQLFFRWQREGEEK